jgi:flagellin
MTISINTNISSYSTNSALNKSQAKSNISLERLSSGLRINSAKDDAGGVSIATRQHAQIRGHNQAIRNVNDGISLSQVAGGALESVTNALQRMRELAVQAGNSTYSSSDIESMTTEFNQLRDHISQVASQTQFNGTNLLDGTFTGSTFQVGSNAGETVTFDETPDIQTTTIGEVEPYNFENTTFEDTTFTGWTIEETNVVFGTDTIAGLNTPTDTTWPDNIATDYDNNPVRRFTSNSGSSTSTKDGSASSIVLSSGIDDLFPGTRSVLSDGVGYAVIRGPYIYSDTSVAISEGQTVSFDWKAEGGVDAYDVYAYIVEDDGTIQTLLDETGTNDGFNDPIPTDWATATNEVTTSGDYRFVFVSGSFDFNGGKALGARLYVDNIEISNRHLSDVTITSTSNALDALNSIDQSLDDVSNLATKFGAFQNRLESTISNLMNTHKNVSSSLSKIQDADIAKETANMIKESITQKAVVSLHAQANQLPQMVLQLLR